MDSSSSSISAIVNEEEFFAFHNIDRQLFSRLVFDMNREPAEAMQVVAVWLWLERLNMAPYVSILLRLSDSVLETVYQETLLCLKVVESDNDDIIYANEVPMVQTIVGRDRVGVNLKFFYENRINILLGVGNIIQQICLRAFRDLIQIVLNFREQLKYYQDFFSPMPPVPRVGVIGGSRGGHRRVGGRVEVLRPVSQPPLPPVYHQRNFMDQGGYVEHPSQIRVGDFSVPLKGPFTLTGNDYEHGSSSSNPNTNHHIYPPQANMSNYGLRTTQPQAVQRDLIDILGQMHSNGNYMPPPPPPPPPPHMGDDRHYNLPCDRTIFLTFSKGYPILEFELRDFFHRNFGDVIETLFMQEVPENEQPLYARLVVRDVRAMEVILINNGRSKFSINGKHVWARKYVRKNNPSSPPYSPINGYA